MSSPPRIQRITSGVSTPYWSDGTSTIPPRASPPPSPKQELPTLASLAAPHVSILEPPIIESSASTALSQPRTERQGSLLSHSTVTPARPGAYGSSAYTKLSNPLQSYIPDNGSKHHMVTFTQVAEELKNNYNFEESITSTSLDILALYLKGQKILHMEAKTLCEKRLNTLMLPAIFISSLCAILNFALNGTTYGPVLVSCFNVANAFLMSLISYLKLDAKAQLHQSSAYKYQKLEALCEFNSGRVLFFKETDDIIQLVDEIHNRVLEIKESNQFILPEQVRHRFHVIFSTNVFTLVKDIQNKEILLINDLKVIIQKMQYFRGLRQKELEHVKTINSQIDSLHEEEKNWQLSKVAIIDRYVSEEVDYRLTQLPPDTPMLRSAVEASVDRMVITKIVEKDLTHIKDKVAAAEEERVMVQHKLI